MYDKRLAQIILLIEKKRTERLTRKRIKRITCKGKMLSGRLSQ